MARMFGSGDDRPRPEKVRSRPASPARPGRAARVAVVTVLLLVAGCSGGLPMPNGDDPERAANELAAGLSKKDVKAVEFVAAASTDVDASLQALIRGMGPLTP